MSTGRRRRPQRDLNPRLSRKRGAGTRLRRTARSTAERPRRATARPLAAYARPAARALILAAELVVLLALVNSPVLAARRVSVAGNRQLSRQQVLQRAGLSGSPSMLLISTDAAEEMLLANPYVRSVSVRTSLPGEVEVEILEWEPLAMLNRGSTFYLLNSEGAVLGTASSSTRTGNGAGQPHFAISWDAPGLLRAGQNALPGRLVQDLDKMAATFPAAYGLSVQSFSFDSNQKLTVNTAGGPRILFGQMATDEQIDSLDGKLGSLKSLRAKIDLANSKLDYIDVENPAAVTTRALPSPSPSPAPSASPSKKP